MSKYDRNIIPTPRKHYLVPELLAVDRACEDLERSPYERPADCEVLHAEVLASRDHWEAGRRRALAIAASRKRNR
jgi:hypothetical protein